MSTLIFVYLFIGVLLSAGRQWSFWTYGRTTRDLAAGVVLTTLLWPLQVAILFFR